MKHNLLKSVIISVILLMGVSNAWGAGIGNLNYVSLTGEFNNWANGSNTAWYFNATDLNNGTANHYIGTFYIPYSKDNRDIRLFMGRNNVGNNNWGNSYAFGGYWLNDAEWYNAEMKTDKANDVLVPFSSQPTSGYLKLECEFYGEYSNNPRLIIDQSAVSVLSPTLVADYTTRSGGQTTTLTASCTGGSGGYTYSYKVTCGGNDVTTTTLSATTGSFVIFTAPNATTEKTYKVTVTAKDAHSLLDGLATKTATTNITVTPVFSVNISSKENGTVNPSGTKQIGTVPLSISATPSTGYTFKQWEVTGGAKVANATSATTTITATAAGTVTAHFSEIIQNITVAANNANYGTVSPTSVKAGIVTQSDKINATPKAGYEFVNWTAESGITLAYTTSTPTHVTKATASGKITANFQEIKHTITIKSNDNTFGTVNKSSASVGQHTAVSITATPKIGYAFKNWTATDGITIANANDATTTIKATKAGTVTANFEAQPSTTIYLEPTGHWNSDHPQYVAHVWNTSGNKDIVMTGLGKSPYQYYKAEVPYGYTNVVFYRKKSDGSVLWNQTADLTLPSENKTLYEIKSTGNGTETKATGVWKEPNITVTLEKTAYGKYAIELNGLKYYSSQSENVVINNVPVESTLRLVSSESFNAAYNNNICIQTHDGVDFEELNAEHRICGNTVIKENFTTLEAHTVYLRVPTSLGSWNTSGANYIYSHNNTANYVVVKASTPTNEEIYKESGYDYFKFVIPAGCRTFRFERKTKQDVAATNVTEEFTRYLPFEMTNCYTIKGIYSENIYYGSWDMSLANGDYRLLYVEQVVEKSNVGGNEWKTVVTRKKAHPSNIIKKGTASQIVSLHVYKERKYTANAGGEKTYESSSNPEVILQQYSNGVWVDKERHMVLGPLQTLPGMAMAPGRRNTAAATATLVYDDGIEIIKDDNEDGRVWNFTVTQDANGVATLPLDGENLVPYEGQYYIRTDNAEGGWMDYTIPDNHMHFSQYAKDNSNFSHYFCKWVETSKKKNTKFVIANDYGVAISDTLSGDQFTDIHGNIQEDANIRWSWNETTNEIARAYIQGAFGDGGAENNNILVSYTTDGSNTPEPKRLEDRGDWIYSIDVNNVKVGSTLKSITATYPKTKHTIDDNVINPTTQIFEQELPMLTGGESANTYTVRVLYDFKIDKTLVALVPNEKEATIGIDVLIERTNQDKPATQVKADISYNNSQRSGEGATVYAVMSFTKAHLTDPNLSNEEKLTYWISFPFNVTLSDVFGFGEVGQYWMIKYYDGADRAATGLIDDNTFWKYITKKSTVLEANKGYVLALNKKVMDPNSPIFTNTNKVSLYFPSTDRFTEIGTGYTLTTCTIPEYKSTLKNREIYDSNWNFIGVPSYADKNITTNTTNVKYFYDYNHNTDKYTVTQNVDSKTFNSMFAYMVQFAGIIYWESFDFKEGAQGLAAKRNTDSDTKQHNLRLELQQNGATADKTFIQLQDEDATQMFDMNSDLCKIINAGSNIYSIISTESTPVNVAGNVLPIQETVIPVGVVISAAGEYTFAMPEGTDGIVVELIDYENNTRTNMLLDNYTVNLGKGTFENRFALHVKPNKTTTSLEDVNTNTTGVNKYLIDGVLYMQKDGVLYDAQGRCVQ